MFAGCAATRPISDAALGAGGAYLGHELSDGNPLATAAGAAGGVLLSEGLHYAAKKQSDKAYAAGYDKGKSDAVKQQYWLYVSMQQQRNQVSNVRLYPVQLPEQRIDGVTFQPSTNTPHRRIKSGETGHSLILGLYGGERRFSPTDFLSVTEELSGEVLVGFRYEPDRRIRSFLHRARCGCSAHVGANPSGAHRVHRDSMLF